MNYNNVHACIIILDTIPIIYQPSEAGAHCSGRDMWMTPAKPSIRRRLSMSFTTI